jgi:hypothetical protein
MIQVQAKLNPLRQSGCLNMSANIMTRSKKQPKAGGSRFAVSK